MVELRRLEAFGFVATRSRLTSSVNLLKFIVNHPLNRGGRFQALSRFARWQIASRLISAPVAFTFVEDTQLLARSGATGATGNWYCGLHELPEMGFVLHALRPGDLFIDVGANLGSYTVLAGGAVGAAVIAVEPLPDTYDKLTANIRLNDLSNRVKSFNCGLSEHAGEMRFTSVFDTMNRIALADEDVPSISVPVRTLDELCMGKMPRVLKIDVEGHELPVLKGGEKVLSAPTLLGVLMETNSSGLKFGVSDDELLAAMTRHGFQPCSYDPFKRELSTAAVGQANTIFVRSIEEMNNRCQAAPRFTLINGTI